MPSNLLDCSICSTPFDNPHILPGCGHTFCLGCIQKIPKTPPLARLHDTTDAACPLCRKRFHFRLVLPNFSLQHVVAEGAIRVDALDDSSKGFDLKRTKAMANIASIYRGVGVPPQLATVLAEEDESIALRVYILDNSGSMNAGDGNIIADDGQVHRTTRWEELKHTAKKHAEWNAQLGVPCEFVLLNPQGQSTPIRIDAQKGNTQEQILALSRLLDRTRANLTTPLTECVETLRMRLRRDAPELQEKDRTLMLVLVTDGIPNGTRAAFAEAIRSLAREQPVHVVVRLCCSDEDIFGFYDQVDKELELSLDILDDFQGEAKAIHRFNPWLTYPKILQTIREAGTLSKLMDFVDERPLTPMEIGLFAQLLIRGEGQSKYPWSPDALLEAVERDAAAAPLVFCVRRRGRYPIMDMASLRPAVNPGKHSLTGQMASAVGLGGVAEAWYEGRTLLDAFQNPKVTQAASTAKDQCVACKRATDGVYPHCCRTCQRTGGREHGPSCQRRNSPPTVEPSGGQEILKLGEVPAGICFLCARGTDGVFPHCCRTCAHTGGTKHGPACENRFAAEGYPQARKGERFAACAQSSEGAYSQYHNKVVLTSCQ